MAPVTDAALPVDEFEVPGKVEAIPDAAGAAGLAGARPHSRVRVTLGDRVRAGQVLLTLETPDVSELQSAWRQAQADVKQREAAVAKAEADVSRVRDLLANRAIAQKEVLVAETELAVATAALEQARATHDDVARRLRLFGVNAEQPEALASVRSPIGGEVVEIAVAPGEYRSDTASPADRPSRISLASGSWPRSRERARANPDRAAGHDRRRGVSGRTVRGTRHARRGSSRSRDAQRAASSPSWTISAGC